MSAPSVENVPVTYETELGADLLAVVARLNRLATQRTRLPLPYAQARLLSTIEDQAKPAYRTSPCSITVHSRP